MHPSDITNITSAHAWVLWNVIRDDHALLKEFMRTSNQKATFVEIFVNKLEELEHTCHILDACCDQGDSFRPFVGNPLQFLMVWQQT